MLEVSKLVAGYGSGTVLHGIDLAARSGEVLALLGRNGMGRTTLIRCLIGQLPVRSGEIRLASEPVHNLASHAIARRGVGLVPEGRQIFPNLTVDEHLQAFARRGARHVDRATIFDLFPRLAERRAHLGQHLSGGEQQMLAIARALSTGPRLLLLDEASEGLAPRLRLEIWQSLAHLKEAGLTIVLIDKPSPELLRLADHCVVIEKGRVVWSGEPTCLVPATAAGNWLSL